MNERMRQAGWLEPLTVPRYILTALYMAYLVLGIVGVVFGIPTLDFTTFDGYRAVWSTGMVLAACFGIVGSLRHKWEMTIEKWLGAIPLGCFLFGYLGGSVAATFFTPPNAPGAGSFAGVVVITLLWAVPASRALSLLLATTGWNKK